MFLGKTGICQFISLNFQIIQDQFPWFLPGGKTAPMFRQGNLFKIFHFPRLVRQSLPGSWDSAIKATTTLFYFWFF